MWLDNDLYRESGELLEAKTIKEKLEILALINKTANKLKNILLKEQWENTKKKSQGK